MQKKKRKQPAKIPGVAQRQKRRNIGDFKDIQPLTTDEEGKDSKSSIKETLNKPLKREDNPVEIITEEDIIENTRSKVDENKIGKKSWRVRRKARKLARKRKWANRPTALRWARQAIRVLFYAAIIYGLYFAIVSWSALSNIIDRGGEGAVALQENIQPSALKGEGDGRINIMLLGIGGEGHKAGNLADTIIIASIDPFANELAMLSIPRDMYVPIPGYYSTRINAAHSIGEDDESYEGGGIALTKVTIEEILGINVHYYMRIDFQGFVDAVDTVGGVTVDLEEAVYDPNFDWQFGSNALNLPAGENTLDGQTALLLARARGATGIGLGVSRGDFGRGDRQRDILLALKDKVLAAGTYANPVRITELIKIAGGHVRTDIQIGEMLRLYEIIEEIPSASVVSFGLDNGADNYLKSANIGGASVLQPKTGNYNEIKLFVRELFVDGFIKQEAPVLDVYNGSTVPGLASETASELETYGYKLGIIDNAPTQSYQTTVIYDLSGGKKPFTKELIAKRFGVTMKPASQIPAQLKVTTSDFVVILGLDNAEEETTF